jgi:hypothetical protein
MIRIQIHERAHVPDQVNTHEPVHAPAASDKTGPMASPEPLHANRTDPNAPRVPTAESSQQTTRSALSLWPTRYALAEPPATYTTSNRPGVFIDSGTGRYFIKDGRCAFPVFFDKDGDTYRIFDPDNPTRPSYPVRHNSETGHWEPNDDVKLKGGMDGRFEETKRQAADLMRQSHDLKRRIDDLQRQCDAMDHRIDHAEREHKELQRRNEEAVRSLSISKGVHEHKLVEMRQAEGDVARIQSALDSKRREARNAEEYVNLHSQKLMDVQQVEGDLTRAQSALEFKKFHIRQAEGVLRLKEESANSINGEANQSKSRLMNLEQERGRSLSELSTLRGEVRQLEDRVNSLPRPGGSNG